MAHNESYFYGFCKTAADMGIDPVELAGLASGEMSKKAAGAARAARGAAAVLTGSRTGDMVGRFVSRLLGSPAIRSEPLKRIQNIRQQLDPLKASYKALLKVPRTDPRVLRTMNNKILRLEGQIEHLYNPIASESRKVRATRWGTGLGGAALYGLYQNNKDDEDEKGSWW